MSKVTDELLDHEYDGIREYDNPLPRWWLITFYGTVAFAAVYVPYYHFGPGLSPVQEYEAELAAAPKEKTIGSADLAQKVKDPAVIAAGKETFVKLCAACHRPDGGGLVGPNLTDDHWIHGGTAADQIKVVTEGVPEKGMISWKAQLSPEQIVQVVAYVGSLRGSNPPKPKAPEGELYTQ